MSDYTQGNSFYDSDSFESLTENVEKGSSRQKLGSQQITKNDKFGDIKNVYTPARNRQRNNNKKVIVRKFSPSQLEFTAQRILSARKHKITDQNNLIIHLRKQIEELKTENKTLKSQFHRQERAFVKFESLQSDVPKMLEQHQSEVINFKEQIKRLREHLTTEMNLRKECENELSSLKSALSKAKQLVSEKGLAERSVLQTQLLQAQDRLDLSEKAVESLTRRLECSEKVHKREVNSLKRQLKSQCILYQDLESELNNIKLNLKEKEKLLEIQNIYSHRFKMPHRIPGSDEDKGRSATCSASNALQNEMLHKLNFSNLNKYPENSQIQTPEHVSEDEKTQTALYSNKIKEDIRKILEEEILSGRIQAYSARLISSDTNQHSSQSSDKEETERKTPSDKYTPRQSSVAQYSTTTGQGIESEIFDKDMPAQADKFDNTASLQYDSESDHCDKDHDRKQKILEQLKYIDNTEKEPNVADSKMEGLKYSYPNDDEFIRSDGSISDIETITTNDVKKYQKSYKFNESIENLHHGIPVRTQITNNNTNRDVSDGRRRISISKPKHEQVSKESSFDQKNNSNLSQSRSDELPPLAELDHQQKERALMVELFGTDFATPQVVHGRPYPNGTIKSRNGSLPWENDAKDNFSKPQTHHQISTSNSFSASEDVEEIKL